MLAKTFNTLAFISFNLLLITSPWRYRRLLLARPTPPVYGDYTDFLLFASDVCLIATLSFWLCAGLLTHEKIRLKPKILLLPLGALLFFALSTLAFSFDVELSAFRFLKMLLLFGLVLYMGQQIKLSQLALGIGLMMGIQVGVGLWQVQEQSSLGLTAWGELRLDPQIRGVSVVLNESGRWLRAYGLADHPNILGGCLAFGLILIWGLPLPQVGRAIVFTLGAATLYLTFSRSAWFALAVGLIILSLGQYKNRGWVQTRLSTLITTLLLILPLVWFTRSFLLSRVDVENQSTATVGLDERAFLNQRTVEVFNQYPLTGVGLGALPEALQQLYPKFPLDYQPAHMALLVVAAEIGLGGAAAYAAVTVIPWLMFGLNRADPNGEKLIALSLISAVIVIGFFDYYTWSYAPGQVWQWVAWGAWASAITYA